MYMKRLNHHSINAENSFSVFTASVIYSAGKHIASGLLLRATHKRRVAH